MLIKLHVFKFIFILLILVSLVTGCRYESRDLLNGINTPCDLSNVGYSSAIRPILNSNGCLSCHSGPVPEGNISLSDYVGLKAKVDDGRLWGAINHFPGFSPMPQGLNKLSDCEISKIKTWIDAGAPNN